MGWAKDYFEYKLARVGIFPVGDRCECETVSESRVKQKKRTKKRTKKRK